MTGRQQRTLVTSAALLLLLAGACATARREPPPEPPLPTVEIEPPPAPEPAPEPEPPAAPESAASPLVAPAQVRVGLATDLEVVSLPCCDGPTVAELGGETVAVGATVTVRPAARAARQPVWRLQIAALREPEEAAGLVRRLAALSGGDRADARFDAASGLYRVRFGAWPSREEADQAGRRLQARGLASYWLVSEGAGLVAPALDVSVGGRVRRIEGRRLVLRVEGDAGLRFESGRYRGALVVFLNDRGRLNVVNELPLEQYLRGVVPRELGPGGYPEIEALKAQAVAARSYTLRNLGEFADEGYDLCGTPKCQVYGGLGAEHPLSDRAIAETAGEILVSEGRPIDALYSATCGGRTEDAEVIFPLKAAPYLRGVTCIEDGLERLPGLAAARPWPEAVTAATAPPSARAPASAATAEAALRALAAGAGLPAPPDDRLASLDRPEVHRFLASLFDLALDPRLFAPNLEVASAGAAAAHGWSEPDRQLSLWLAESGLLDDGAGAPALGVAEVEDLLLHLALGLRLVERRAAVFDRLQGGDLLVREGGAVRGYRLDAELAPFADAGDGPRPVDLFLAGGDPLDLYLVRGRLVALVQHLSPDAAPAGRVHPRSSWNRTKTRAELAASVRQRFPGFDFADFDVVARGPSGRVGRIRLIDRDGSSVEVTGLAVRWLLDLPDTWFTVRRTRRGGEVAWQFTGRGWGHGVGLCQFGSFSMARRGLSYRDILAHYYAGARLVTLASGSAAEPAPSVTAEAPGR